VDRRYVKKSQKRPDLLHVVDMGALTKKMMVKTRPLKGDAGPGCTIDEHDDLMQQEYCSNQTTSSGRGSGEEGEPNALESLRGMKK
jgi:hypothetical protein